MKRLLAIAAVVLLSTLGLSTPAGAATDPAVAQGQADRLYSAYFLRDPDLNGLKFWVDRLLNAEPLANVSQFFAGSDEFEERYGDLDDGAFVDLVYQNVLEREPDANGRAEWIRRLESGETDRGRLMIGFSESPEYVEKTGTTPPTAEGFGDGDHQDVAPGTWRNVRNGESCTWTRQLAVTAELTDEEPDDGVVATATVSGEGRSIVTIEEGDAAFVTEGCGDWVPDVGPITLRPNQPFVSGTYKVGRDIVPGTWTASNTAECTWSRLSGFSGEDDEVIETGTGTETQTVTIAESDVGFTADEACGTWTLQPGEPDENPDETPDETPDEDPDEDPADETPEETP